MIINYNSGFRLIPAKTIIFILIFNINIGYADWVNLSGAENAENIFEIYIHEDGVKVQFEIFPVDLAKFVPNNKGQPTLAFQVLADGEPLPSYISLIEKRERVDRYSPFAGMVDPRTRRTIPGPPEDKRVIYVEAFYPYENKPSSITLVPPLDEDQNVEVTIGFIAFHDSVPINDFRYLSKPEKLILEWDDPWYTTFENKNIKRHHDSPLMSFLYVEPHQVRLEGLMRVKDLFEWEGIAGQDLQDKTFNRNTIQQLAKKVFKSRTAIEIDGQTPPINTANAVFLKITPRGLRADNSDSAIDPAVSIIGVSQAYWLEHLPDSVKVNLDLFTDRTRAIPFVMTDPAGPFPGRVNQDDPAYAWENYLTNYEESLPVPVRVVPSTVAVPVISLILLIIASVFAVRVLWLKERNKKLIPAGIAIACVITAMLFKHVLVINQVNPFQNEVPDSSPQIAALVLENIKAVYLQKDPNKFRQALGQVVAAKSPDDIVYELDQVFAVPVLTGRIASAVNIEVTQLDEITAYESNEHFRALATMNVQARAQHWGHADFRILNFRALMEFKKINGNWMLSDFTVVDIKPIDMSNPTT